MDLQTYLDRFQVRYHITEHPVVYTSQALAEAEHVSGYQVIKPVLIEADGQWILVALPAAQKIDLERLAEDLDAKDVRIATEKEMGEAFPGCELGAEPPIGALFGLPTIADESLFKLRKVTFQAGNHHEAVTMSTDDYRRLAQPGVGHFTLHS